MRATLKKLLLMPAVRRRVRSWRALHQSASCCDKPAVSSEPGGGNIVVLAPHMDDEVLGCGGTVAQHVRAGATVTFIFLTDGRHGAKADAALPESEREHRMQELIGIRKQEARHAADVLGVQDIFFLDAEDQRLLSDPGVVARLRGRLQSLRPDVVYLPFFLERHPDHRAANDVLLSATADGALEFECRGYEVWTPLPANLVVAIDATLELKKSALACYRSQLREMDHVHFAVGLNAYRASALRGTGRYAEAFHALPLADYRRFHRAVCLS